MCGLAGSVLAQVEPERADGPIASYVGHRLIRVEIGSARELQTLLALTDDVWTESIRMSGPIDVRVSPTQLAAVASAGLKFRILINDLQATVDAESALIRDLRAGDDAAWYTSYHNYADNKTYMQALAAAFPGLATYSVIGVSLQGREIFALRITGPGSTASRPASIWWGGQHAREWLNVPQPEYHAEQLLTKYATDPHIKYLVDNHEFLFVPIMNPDGYDYTWTNDRFWRKNRRPNSNNPGSGCGTNFGVDLNRNWGFQWGALNGSSGVCSSETYRGVAAFSEPETQVMRDFVLANPRIKLMMDWHTYGQLVLSPWGYANVPVTPPGQAQIFQTLDTQLVAALRSGHNVAYTPGPVYTTLYPANGISTDWAWGDRGALGFTIELPGGGSGGFDPPPTFITPTCEDTWAAFLFLANYLTPCYANCDLSTSPPTLNANDFQCFLNAFASGLSSANCDGSTASPTLTANDFQCFLSVYAVGCP